MIDPACRKYTAFVIPGSQYEYAYMPFGLTNAPRTFQRIIQLIFTDYENVRIYLDDILIFSKENEDHEKKVEELVTILHQNGIQINWKKSIFREKSIEFLGRNISKDGMKPITKNLPNMHEFEQPRTIRKLQSLIGYINWFREFIPRLSMKMMEVTEKLKIKKALLKQTENEKNIIKQILEEINKETLIHHINPILPFTLQTDVSDYGLSAILYQKQALVGIFSKKLSKTETNYTVMEKEFLAIYKSLEQFKKRIIGYKIYIKTDNKNLIHIGGLNKRVQRWKIAISDFDIKIIHVNGTKMKLQTFSQEKIPFK